MLFGDPDDIVYCLHCGVEMPRIQYPGHSCSVFDVKMRHRPGSTSPVVTRSRGRDLGREGLDGEHGGKSRVG